jgi:hypothetical protein
MKQIEKVNGDVDDLFLFLQQEETLWKNLFFLKNYLHLPSLIIIFYTKSLH